MKDCQVQISVSWRYLLLRWASGVACWALPGLFQGQPPHQARKMGGTEGQVTGVQAEGVLTNSDLALVAEAQPHDLLGRHLKRITDAL